MKKIVIILMFCFAFLASAQTPTVTTSGTVVDSQGTTWTNGSITATFTPNSSNPYGQYYVNGTLIPSTLYNTQITLDNTGSFTQLLFDNKLVTPAGSTYTFTVCSNTTAQCSNVPNIVITGTTQSLSALFMAQITPPNVTAPPLTKAYNDAEVQAITKTLSALYYNVTNSLVKVWNGTAWVALGTGGGGGTAVPGGPTNAVQVNNGTTTFAGYAGFTFVNSTGLFTVPTIIDTAGIQAQSYFDNIPRAEYDPLDPQYAGGLAAATTPAQQTAVVDAVVQKAECDIIAGTVTAAKIVMPSKYFVQLTHTEIIYANEEFACSVSPEYGGCDINMSTPGIGPVIETAALTQLNCSGSLSVPTGNGAYIHNFTINGGSAGGGANDHALFIQDGHAMASHNLIGQSTGFGGEAVQFNATDSYLFHNYIQNGDQYYIANSAGGVNHGTVQFVGTDSKMLENEVTDGYGLINSHHLVGVNPLNIACVDSSSNGVVANNLLQLCNVGIITEAGSNALTIATNRFDGMSGPAIINNAQNSNFLGNLLNYECLDPTSTTCSLLVMNGAASGNLVTGTQYGLTNGQFGTSNFNYEFLDQGNGANKYSANATIPGKTYGGSNLLADVLLNATSIAEVDYNVLSVSGNTAPNVDDYTTVNFTDTVPITASTFHGGVLGHSIRVLGGNSNVTIANGTAGFYGFLPIHTVDGQNINLGNVKGDVTFHVEQNAIVQDGNYYSAYLRLNSSTSTDILAAVGNLNLQPIPGATVGAAPVNPGTGSGTCYSAQATVGTGVVTSISSYCTSFTASAGSPVALQLTVPAQYNSYSIYRYSTTAGSLNAGLLATYTTGTAPSTYNDVGAVATGTVPALNYNTTGWINLNGTQISNLATTPTIGPINGTGNAGLNINQSGLTYWNGSAWTTISGGGGGGSGTVSGQTNGFLPLATAPTVLSTNAPLDYNITNTGGLTTSVPFYINHPSGSSQLTFIPTGNPLTVPSSGIAIGAPTTVTTPSVTNWFTAPGTGIVTVTNTSGSMQLGISTTIGPTVGTLASNMVADYGTTNTDNGPLLTTYLTSGCTNGITPHVIVPAGSYDFKNPVTVNGTTNACSSLWLTLLPGANLYTDTGAWTGGASVGILNFNDLHIKIDGAGKFYTQNTSEGIKVQSTTVGYDTQADITGESCDSSANQCYDVTSSIFNLATGPLITYVNISGNRCTTLSALSCIAVRQAINVHVNKNKAFAPCSSAGAAGCGGIDLQAIDGLDVGENDVLSQPYTTASSNPIGQFHFLEISNATIHGNHALGGGSTPPGAAIQLGSNFGYYCDTCINTQFDSNVVFGGGGGYRFEVGQQVSSTNDTTENTGTDGMIANTRGSNLVQLASLNQSATWVTAGTNITQTYSTSDYPSTNMSAIVSTTSGNTTITTLAGDCCLGILSGSTFTINGTSFTAASNGTATGITTTVAPTFTTSTGAFLSPFTGSVIETFGSGFTSGNVINIATTGTGVPGNGLNWATTPISTIYIKPSTNIPYGQLTYNYVVGGVTVATENLPSFQAGVWAKTPPIWTRNWGFKLRGTVQSVYIAAASNPGTGATIQFANLEQNVPGSNIHITNPHIRRTQNSAIYLWGGLDTVSIDGGDGTDIAYNYNSTNCSSSNNAPCSSDYQSFIQVSPNKDGGDQMYNVSIHNFHMKMTPGGNPYIHSIQLSATGSSNINGISIIGNDFSGINAQGFNTISTQIQEASTSNDKGPMFKDNLYDTVSTYGYKDTDIATGVAGNPSRKSFDCGGGSTGCQALWWRNSAFNTGVSGVLELGAGDGTSTVITAFNTRGGLNSYIYAGDTGVTGTQLRHCFAVFNNSCPSGGEFAVGGALAAQPFQAGLIGDYSGNNGSAYGSFIAVPMDTPNAPNAVGVGSGGTAIYYLVGRDNQGNATVAGTSTSAITVANPPTVTNYVTITQPTTPARGVESYDVYRSTNTVGLATGYIGTIYLAQAVPGTPAANTGYNALYDTGQAIGTIPPAGIGSFSGTMFAPGFGLLNSTASHSVTLQGAATQTANTIVTVAQPVNTGEIMTMGYSGVTGSIGGSALAAGACTTTSATVTGATTNMKVLVSAANGTDPGGNFIPRGFVVSANTLTIEVCAITAGTPTSTQYNYGVYQ